jgi:Arc/MetJ family transcription regulator
VAKTTIDISESLLAEAKEVAAREGTTLRALVESGLRTAIDRRLRGERFRLRDASVDGTGLQPEFRDAGWERVRDAAYEGRGA